MFVDADGVRLFIEVTGAEGPVVLLVSPADAPSHRWPRTLVAPLVEAGHRVVAYDHRDVGASDRVPATEPYDLGHLVADALAVLDALDEADAHVVGRSMGAMVGQLLAIDHPERVASLTLVGSTPEPGASDLAPPDDDLVDAIAGRLFAGPPADAGDAAGWVVDGYRVFAGSAFPFEVERQSDLAAVEVARGWLEPSGHGVAVHSTPGWRHRLGSISAPTLVVHGTEDPVYPIDHGLALIDEIGGAEGWVVEGLGHELPDALGADLARRILEHLARAGAGSPGRAPEGSGPAPAG